MDYNKIFHKVPVQVQNRSAFSCSHKNLFSSKVGTLVPVLVDPLIPNTTVNLGMACQTQLPPLVSDFYGTIYAKMEAFFVPNRIIWAGWKDFITTPIQWSPEQTSLKGAVPTTLPSVTLNYMDEAQNFDKYFGPGTLADMLGFKTPITINSENPTESITLSNILPFLAYHKIYDDWYRDSRLQKPIFNNNSQEFATRTWVTAPFNNGNGYTAGPSEFHYESVFTGASIFAYHQRNFQRDYFTNATALPQAGIGASVEFTVSGTSGEFSIAALRAANSLQQWFERNNIAGERYSDQIKARFGIYPSDTITDRAIYLGQKTFTIYQRTVYESVPTDTTNSKNPFSGQLGSKASAVQGFGEDTLINSFTASEHGHLIVIFSLVPEPLYSSGTRRYLTYSEITDFPDPLLQGVGDQEIYSFEIDQSMSSVEPYTMHHTFGYTQRYSEAKFMNDEVHGLLRDGQNLQSFALQRSFDGTTTEIGSDFITIPQDYLDQVSNVDTEVSKFGCWSEVYFKYNKVQPLAAYSIPTLGDPRDTHTEIIDNGGTRL